MVAMAKTSSSGGEGGDILDGGLTFSKAVSFSQAIETGDNVRAAVGDDIPEDFDLFPDAITLKVLDDNDADTLSGGNGNDLIFMGSGDEATGGDGQDDFVIVADEALGSGSAVSTITDFDPDEDAVAVLVNSATDAPEVDTAEDTETGDTLITVDGNIVARLEGVAIDRVGDISVAFFEETPAA